MPPCGPGITTDELDAIAHEECIKRGGYPSPLGYNGYPKSLCTSVNEVICHGIPDSTVLKDGDIVNCDVTIYLDGVHGDTNATFLVGEVDEESRRLVEVTRECLDKGIGAVRPGAQVRDIGKAIQAHAEGNGFGVIRAFVGHGIGPIFHDDPQIYHYDNPAAREVLEAGMTFTIEPMISVGDWHHQMWDDELDRRHGRPQPDRAVRAHPRRHRGRRGDPDPGLAHRRARAGFRSAVSRASSRFQRERSLSSR